MLFDGDGDAVQDFLDSLNEQEKSIIDGTNDIHVLQQLKATVESDLDETAKDLAMDD